MAGKYPGNSVRQRRHANQRYFVVLLTIHAELPELRSFGIAKNIMPRGRLRKRELSYQTLLLVVRRVKNPLA